MTTPPIAFVDFETRSRADLKAIGGRRYAEHPSTEVVCAVIRSTHGVIDEWAPGRMLPREFLRFDKLAAHNAINFDRHIWRKLGWPEPGEWVDTAELARVAGFPQASLEWLGENLAGKPKDLEGNKLTRQLSAPELYYGPALETVLTNRKAQWKAANKGRLPTAQIKAQLVADLDRANAKPAPIPADVLERVIKYCRLDVEIMADLWEGVLWEWYDADLPGLVAADRNLNDRGICFDRELAQILIDASEELGRVACERAGVSPSVVRSTQQLTAAVRAAGYVGALTDCTADTIAELTKSPIEAVANLARARQSVASIAIGKLEAGLARCSPDGRLRDNRTYMGAHTGRWAGRGMQLDNLAKGVALEVEPTIAALRSGELRALYKGKRKGDPSEWRPLESKAVNTLVRACLYAPPGRKLVVIDFSQIEARALAWCAGDHEALKRFALYDSGDQINGDPYAAMAAQIFGGGPADYVKGTAGEYPGRHIGKQAELGCGYGMGVQRFHDKVIEDGSSWAVITEAARRSGAIGAHEEVTADMVVGAWRTLHAPIVAFWRELNDACMAAVNGGSAAAGPFEFVNVDGVVYCRLPSGRLIAYRGCRVSKNEKGRPELSYQGKRGREKLYGGKLAENAIQAMCRDLMAEALVESEEQGLCPCHTVHDELIDEVPADEAEDCLGLSEAIMVRVRPWAAGMPIAAEGFFCERYSK